MEKITEEPKEATIVDSPTDKASESGNVIDLNITYGDNDVGKNIASTPTQESTNDPFEPEVKKEFTEEELDASLAEDDKKEWSAKDLKMSAEFIVQLIDAVSSNVCKKISGESDASQFEISPDQREKLVYILAQIMHKYQVKMGPMTAMLLALTMFFGLQFKEAYSIRLDKQAKEDEDFEKTQIENAKAAVQRAKMKILTVLKTSPLTLSALTAEVKIKEDKVKKYLGKLVNEDLVITDEDSVPVKYKAAS